ncbi:hypothetical protein [Nocardia nova]
MSTTTGPAPVPATDQARRTHRPTAGQILTVATTAAAAGFAAGWALGWRAAWS